MTAKERIRTAAGQISGGGQISAPVLPTMTAKERISLAAQTVNRGGILNGQPSGTFQPLMAQKAAQSPTMRLAAERAFNPKASEVILKQSAEVNKQVAAAESEVRKDTLARDKAAGGYAAAWGGTKTATDKHPVASTYAASRDSIQTVDQKATAGKAGNLGRLLDRQNKVAGAYYVTENEEQRERLLKDRPMWEKNLSIGELQNVIGMAQRVAADAQNPGSGGEPGAVLQAKERLAREYGITPEAIRSYALYGDDDSIPADGTYTNISQFIHQLERQQQTLADEMKEAGYDYGRMAEYQNRRKTQAEARVKAEERQKAARENPGLASLGTVLVKPLQGMEYAGALLSGIGRSDPSHPKTYVPINTAAMDITNAVNTTRGEVAKMAEERWGPVGSFGYQTGMSMADFLFTAGGTGNFSGGGKVASNLSLGIMGSGAAADTTVSALNRGLSNRQALTLGAIAGVAEILTEKVSLESLLDMTSLSKSRLGYVLQNIIAEGSEEAASDVINWVADVMVSRDQSEWRQTIAAYRAQGMDENQAFWCAMRDQAAAIGVDALGGAISGGTMAGGSVAIDMYQNRAVGRDFHRGLKSMDGVYQAVIDSGLESAPDTSAAQRPVVNIKNAPAEGAQKRASDRDAYTVIQKLGENISTLDKDAPVAKVSSAAVENIGGRTMAEKARALFSYIKGVVNRAGFGEVEINDRSVKDDLSHGVGVAKAMVIPSIPEVIRKGRQIDFQENWKGRGYDGYVFAAPVKLDKETVFVAAVVKRTSKNRFYLHEVVDSRGNIIKMGSRESATQTSLAADGDAGTQSPLPIGIIPQPPVSVNIQAATPAGKISDLEVLHQLAVEMVSSRTEDLGPDGLVPEISSRPVQQSAQEILSRLAREMTQDPTTPLVSLSDEDIKAMLDEIARGQGGEATAGETDISGEADSESDIGDALRNVAKRLAQSGQAVGFAELPRKIRQAFESELVGATPDTQKALQKIYPKTDYILVSGKRSRYVHGPRNVILLSKYAPPSTLAHELFHELDQGYKISRTFIESLMKDYVALNVKSGGDIVGYLRQKFPEAFVKSGIAGKHYLTKQHRGISDIINGLTDGQVFLGYGHKESYWKKADKLEAEAWAQFGRVQFENQADVLKMFQSLFPNFYKSAMIALKELI